MIGMLICGLLRGPRPAGAPAEPPLTATAAAVRPVDADDRAATDQDPEVPAQLSG